MIPFSKLITTAGLMLLCTTAVLSQDVVDRTILPIPEQPFSGKIGRTVAESVKDFPRMIEAPDGAPNNLLILTDDVGFGASSTFGGPIPTVTMD